MKRKKRILKIKKRILKTKKWTSKTKKWTLKTKKWISKTKKIVLKRKKWNLKTIFAFHKWNHRFWKRILDVLVTHKWFSNSILYFWDTLTCFQNPFFILETQNWFSESIFLVFKIRISFSKCTLLDDTVISKRRSRNMKWSNVASFPLNERTPNLSWDLTSK